MSQTSFDQNSSRVSIGAPPVVNDVLMLGQVGRGYIAGMRGVRF
jgi:hypothetical protein